MPNVLNATFPSDWGVFQQSPVTAALDATQCTKEWLLACCQQRGRSKLNRYSVCPKVPMVDRRHRVRGIPALGSSSPGSSEYLEVRAPLWRSRKTWGLPRSGNTTARTLPESGLLSGTHLRHSGACGAD